MNEDTRTPEEHMADVAGATLQRLAMISDEMESLHRQLFMLGVWTHEHDNIDMAHKLMTLSKWAEVLTCEFTFDLVRDVAQTLPIRNNK